jgi:mono/diheme cytochrome c family protein
MECPALYSAHLSRSSIALGRSAPLPGAAAERTELAFLTTDPSSRATVSPQIEPRGDREERCRRSWGRIAPGLGMAIAIVLATTHAFAAGDAHHGEEIFKRYCQGCHGPNGNGGAKGFMPHIGPLSRKGYIDQLPDEYLATVITQGGEATGKSAFMPSWKTTLSEQDIADVIAYIRTFVLN